MFCFELVRVQLLVSPDAVIATGPAATTPISNLPILTVGKTDIRKCTKIP